MDLKCGVHKIIMGTLEDFSIDRRSIPVGFIFPNIHQLFKLLVFFDFFYLHYDLSSK